MLRAGPEGGRGGAAMLVGGGEGRGVVGREGGDMTGRGEDREGAMRWE